MIEVEVKIFLTENEYSKLFDFFNNNGKFIKEDNQETYYFDAPVDLRIQKNDFFSKIVLKKGIIHDEQREEIEVKFAKEDFNMLEKIFLSLGYSIKIKWLRKRFEFEWNDVSICLDNTKGYGHILEVEKLCEEIDKDKVLEELKSKIAEIGLTITPREEFEKKYEYYKQNWRSLV